MSYGYFAADNSMCRHFTSVVCMILRKEMNRVEEAKLECISITCKKETGMTMLKPQKQLLQFVMLSLLSVVSVLVMANESYAGNMDCGSCHGNGINPATGQLITSTDMRPVDATFRNITTGGFVGSHQSHMKANVAPNATAAVTACAACHSNTVAYNTGHRSGTITFNAAVAYNKGVGPITFTNATSVPVLGTCGTASCHVSPVSTAYVVTPYWGTNTAAGCTGCHTGANLITATGPATGSHALAGHVTACIDCHAAGTTATVAPTTGHLDGNIDVANVGYLTLNKTKGSAGTTCSTATCHASPVAATTVVTPAWGTVGAGCAACHSGVNAITATGPATGNHAIPGHVTACTDCHAAGTTATVAPTAGHADGNIDVANVGYATLNKTKGTAGTTCSAASCHASPVAATLVVTPAWGTTGNGCVACHSGVNVITATGPATGSHALAGHVAACTACHAAGSTATVAPTTGHADGNIDVANVGYATLNKTKGTAGTTCSAASCHASPVAAAMVVTPAWGTVGAGCAACHTGVNAITATGPATGNHAIPGHVTACTACHAAGSTATVAPTAGHNDGNIDVANVGYATLNKTKGTAGTTCSAASCHASPVAATLVVTPAWGTTGNGCVACHSGVNVITATGPATGSHALTGHAAACTACHAAGSTATVAPTTGHNDGNIDVANVGYLTLNKTKGTAGTTCSAASCHASPVNATLIVTPAWGTTGAGCVACHAGVNAITATGPATGSHALVGHAAACTACHAAGTTATVAPTAGHIDGNIDVANVGYLTLNKTKGTAGTTCSAASCHVSPVNATLVVTPAWGTTGAGCAACHTGANLITATGPNTYGHNLHMLRTAAPTAIVCIDCHAAGTTATTAPSLANGHTDGNIDVTVGGYALNKTKGSAVGTCSNIACHNSPAGYAPAFTAGVATWGSNLSCNGCHGYPPAGPNHAGVAAGTCNSCHSNVKPGNVLTSTNTIFVNNNLHMNEKVDEGRCDTCHGYPPVRSMAGRGTNLLGYSSAKMQNYSGGGGVHDVAGHLPTTLKYSNGGGFAACLACHPSNLHNQANASFGGFSTSLVQVVVDPKYKFDKNRAIVYNAKQSGPGLKTTGTCANVECHYQKSPVWSSEAYTQRH